MPRAATSAKASRTRIIQIRLDFWTCQGVMSWRASDTAGRALTTIIIRESGTFAIQFSRSPSMATVDLCLLRALGRLSRILELPEQPNAGILAERAFWQCEITAQAVSQMRIRPVLWMDSWSCQLLRRLLVLGDSQAAVVRAVCGELLFCGR